MDIGHLELTKCPVRPKYSKTFLHALFSREYSGVFIILNQDTGKNMFRVVGEVEIYRIFRTKKVHTYPRSHAIRKRELKITISAK